MKKTVDEIRQIYSIRAESVQAVLTCLRFEVWEKDFEQMEQV